MERVISLKASISRCLEMREKAQADSADKAPIEELIPECREPFSVDRVAGDFLSDANWTYTIKLINYYECAALVAGNASPCRALAGSPSRHKQGTYHIQTSREDFCRRFSNQAALAKAIITRDPAAKRLCEQMCSREPDGHRMISPGSAQLCTKICYLIVDNRDSPDQLCAQQMQLVKREPAEAIEETRRGCRMLFPMLYGLESSCANLNPASMKETFGELCQSFVTFRKAHQAKNIRLCRKDALCGAMMTGQMASCQGYADEIKALYCNRETLGQWPDQTRHVVEALARLRALRSARAVKFQQIDDTCAKLRREAMASLDKVYSFLTGVLPGTPGRDERIKKVVALMKQPKAPQKPSQTKTRPSSRQPRPEPDRPVGPE